jgi:hypothetical protein
MLADPKAQLEPWERAKREKGRSASAPGRSMLSRHAGGGQRGARPGRLPSGLGAKMSLAHAIKSEVEMGLWKRSLEERCRLPRSLKKVSHGRKRHMPDL